MKVSYKSNWKSIHARIKEAGRQGIVTAANDIFETSQELAPMEHGNLRQTAKRGHIQNNDNIFVYAISYGYNKPPRRRNPRYYAIPQHIGAPDGAPSWSHLSDLNYTTEGTGPHYLIDSFVFFTDSAIDNVVDEIRKVIG